MTFLRGDVAERLHRPVQASEGFPDRNQPAALTLHGFSFSHDGRSALKRCSLGLDLYLWTAYKRVNGPYKLVMIAGADCKLHHYTRFDQVSPIRRH